MPWTVEEPPRVAKSWTRGEREKCVAAANAVLEDGGSDEEAIFACIRAAGKSEGGEMGERWLVVSTVDLAGRDLASDQAVEILREGTFEDRHGRRVTVTAEDLETYVANFKRGAAGQDVPIDIDHERGKAAGWLRELWTEVREFALPEEGVPGGERVVSLRVLKALPDWNELGRGLVGGRIYRYFSAAVDLASRTIKSVSLVNFPAVKGLQPAELAQGEGASYGLVSVDDGAGAVAAAVQREVTEMSEEVQVDPVEAEEALRERIRAEERARLEAELAEREEQVIELRQRIRAEERARLEAELAERREVTELAQGLCAGDVALSSRTEDVAELLLKLDAETRAQVVALLQDKVVQFGEIGSSREGAKRKSALTPMVKDALAKWVASGQSVAAFFDVNAGELGEMGEWDVSAFEDKQA